MEDMSVVSSSDDDIEYHGDAEDVGVDALSREFEFNPDMAWEDEDKF